MGLHTKHCSLAQPTLNLLGTLTLAYNWAIILCFTSIIIVFLDLFTINRRHRLVFCSHDGMQNAKCNTPQMVATLCIVVSVFILTTMWLPGSYGLLPLPGITRDYHTRQ